MVDFMRFRLRTLIIVLAVLPVLVWVAWLIYSQLQYHVQQQEIIWQRTLEHCMQGSPCSVSRSRTCRG